MQINIVKNLVEFTPENPDETAKLETLAQQVFEYVPMKISENPSSDDLDYSLTVQFGDIGELLPFELDNIVEADGLFTKPILIYRSYRSDDLTQILYGPIELKIRSFAFNREGATFEATVDRANSQRTGEIYTIARFPMLRVFL
jgi:hypothetical protein